jgi:S1-C subfamily serine protease
LPSFSPGAFVDLDYFDGVRFIRTTARCDHGCSGGALFDRFGNLIGILHAITNDHTVTYALIVDDWWS